MKKLTVIILCLALCLGALAGCGDAVIGPAPTATPASGTPADTIDSVPDDGPKGAEIMLEGSGASIRGSGVSASGSTVTIASPGSYTVSGTLDDGCIVVNTGEVKGDVTLTLRGASITCLSGAAIHVIEAKNFDLVLEDGTQNRLVSGSPDAAVTGKQDGAALFCEDDLDILGSGSLEVYGYLNNGITCKDDLDIKDGTLSVTAVNNGVKGSESVEIFGGSLSVIAGNDGVKTSSAKKEGKGFVTVEGGTVTITAQGDGISAETALTVSGGEIRVKTTGDRTAGSCKALKAKTVLTVSGGTAELDSEDHALHSAGDMLLSGGTLAIVSRAGKGVSAHGTLELGGSALDVRDPVKAVATVLDALDRHADGLGRQRDAQRPRRSHRRQGRRGHHGRQLQRRRKHEIAPRLPARQHTAIAALRLQRRRRYRGRGQNGVRRACRCDRSPLRLYYGGLLAPRSGVGHVHAGARHAHRFCEHELRTEKIKELSENLSDSSFFQPRCFLRRRLRLRSSSPLSMNSASTYWS